MRFDDICACCQPTRLSRRGLLLGAGAATVAATLPGLAFAKGGNYEAMLLGCIDPRLHVPMDRYTARRKLTGRFSQFIIAGAAIGVVAEPFKDWHKAYWDNVNTSVQLHNIKRVIAINHRDCGAARIAYGAESVASRKAETETHRKALAEFRKQMNERLPRIKVETGLMDLNGRIEML